MNQNHIIDNFTDSCLEDISNKLQMLPDLQADATHRLRDQAEVRIDNISKVFLDLEDLVVKMLREKIRILFTQQEKIIEEQLRHFELEIGDKVQQKSQQLKTIQQKIETHAPEGKKWLGKFAQGKVERNWQEFKEEILEKVELPLKSIKYEKEELEQLVDEIIELLNIKQKQLMPPNISGARNIQSAKTNQSHLSSYSKRTSKSINLIKNQSIISKVISQLPSEEEPYHPSFTKSRSSKNPYQYGGDSAIMEHKQTKTIKKRQKLQREAKMEEKKETKTINAIAQLVLEKQKLLKQLE